MQASRRGATKGHKKQMSVALLLSQVQDVKNVTQVFKQIGVIPHFYEDLRSFWRGTLESIPTLCIVDIKMMSENDLTLKDHPYIMSEQLPIAFFYEDGSAPLLYSTFEFFHLGFIRKEGLIKGQIKSVLKRLNKMMALETSERDLQLENKKLSKQMTKFVDKTQSYKEANYYENMLKDICSQFESQREKGDFFSVCERVFGGWGEVDAFACLELSHNGQKLISPMSAHPKFKKISSLWLGQTCKQGIEYFGQNMASQVCVDLLGGELMSLNIRGRHQNPDMILYLKIEDQALLDAFDWESLERYLSGVYAYFKLLNQADYKQDGKVLEPWELMAVLDGRTFSNSNLDETLDYALINLDLSELVNLVRTNSKQRFYWKSFFHEFLNRLADRKPIDFQVTCMGVENIGLLVEREKADEFFQTVKTFALRFSYWRYFEDADMALTKDMKPIVKMVPFSSTAYLEFVDGSHPLVEDKNLVAKERTQRMIWGTPPTQSM